MATSQNSNCPLQPDDHSHRVCYTGNAGIFAKYLASFAPADRLTIYQMVHDNRSTFDRKLTNIESLRDLIGKGRLPDIWDGDGPAPDFIVMKGETDG